MKFIRIMESPRIKDNILRLNAISIEKRITKPIPNIIEVGGQAVLGRQFHHTTLGSQKDMAKNLFWVCCQPDGQCDMRVQ